MSASWTRKEEGRCMLFGAIEVKVAVWIAKITTECDRNNSVTAFVMLIATTLELGR